jgi:hypothetical protein
MTPVAPTRAPVVLPTGVQMSNIGSRRDSLYRPFGRLPPIQST